MIAWRMKKIENVMANAALAESDGMYFMTAMSRGQRLGVHWSR